MLKVFVPKDADERNKAIEALKWQIENAENEKDRGIFEETLSIFENYENTGDVGLCGTNA